MELSTLVDGSCQAAKLLTRREQNWHMLDLLPNQGANGLNEGLFRDPGILTIQVVILESWEREYPNGIPWGTGWSCYTSRGGISQISWMFPLLRWGWEPMVGTSKAHMIGQHVHVVVVVVVVVVVWWWWWWWWSLPWRFGKNPGALLDKSFDE